MILGAEERLRAMIWAWEADLLARIQKAGTDGQVEIVRWVADYIATLQVEMPLSVTKQVLRGGAVRSILFDHLAPGHQNVEVRVGNESRSVYLQEVEVGEREAYLPDKLRVTVIVEPVP